MLSLANIELLADVAKKPNIEAQSLSSMFTEIADSMQQQSSSTAQVKENTDK